MKMYIDVHGHLYIRMERAEPHSEMIMEFCFRIRMWEKNDLIKGLSFTEMVYQFGGRRNF